MRCAIGLRQGGETKHAWLRARLFEDDDEYEHKGIRTGSIRTDFFVWQSPSITVFLQNHREYEINPNPFCKASRWVVLGLFLLFLVGLKQLLSCGSSLRNLSEAGTQTSRHVYSSLKPSRTRQQTRL